MAIPWFQIARLVPEIVAVSRELLQQSRNPAPVKELAIRVGEVEQNQRKQAELAAKMARQLAAMAEAGTTLRRQVAVLWIVTAISLLVAIVALVAAL